MDKTYIVAFVCEDRAGELHFVQLSQPVDYNTIIFKDEKIIADSYIICMNWYQSITVCTEETLELFRQNLQIAI
jgi:hypothetical protein